MPTLRNGGRWITPGRLALMESNRWVNISFGLVLVLWLFQDLLLRDLFLPVEEHRKLHHVLDMLSVVWGSFVTGYIFHWVVDHMPAMRKEWDRRTNIEIHLLYVIDSYKRVFVQLLKKLPRDNTKTDSVFRKIIGDIPDLWHKLATKEGLWNVDTPMIEGSYADRFGVFFGSAHSGMVGHAYELLELRDHLDWYLVDVLQDLIDWCDHLVKEDPDADEDIRTHNLAGLNFAIYDLYEYLAIEADKGKILDSHLVNALRHSSYQDLWDIAEEELKQRAEQESIWKKHREEEPQTEQQL